jgi:hypothetical protein
VGADFNMETDFRGGFGGGFKTEVGFVFMGPDCHMEYIII